MLSQRFDCVPGVDAFEIYRALRIVNPSPYMYFLRFGVEETVVQRGKETRRILWGLRRSCWCGCTGGHVEYRPIAGTRPRSADEVEDRAH